MKKFLLFSVSVLSILFCLTDVAVFAADAAHHGDAANKGLPQLNPQSFPSQVFWLIVSFAVLYFFIARTSLAKVTNIKTEREIKSDKDRQATEELQRETDQLKVDYETALTDAREQARKSYQETFDKLQKQASDEKEMLQNALKEKIDGMSTEIDDLQKKSKDEVEQIALAITKEVISKVANIDVDPKIIEQKVKELM